MLNANNLKVAKIATNDDGSRYTLSAINVTPDYTEATDGHQALRVTTPKTCGEVGDFPEVPGVQPVNEFPAFLLGKEQAENLLKMLGNKKTPFPILNNIVVGAETCTNGHSVFGLCAGKELGNQQRIQFTKPEDQFPNVDYVMPNSTEEPVQTFRINPQMLGNLLLLVASMSDDPKRGVEVKWYKRGDACLIVFEATNAMTEQKATAVVMGMDNRKR